MSTRLRRIAVIFVAVTMVCFGQLARSMSPAFAKSPVAVGFVTGGYATQVSLGGSIPLQGAVEDNTYSCAVAKTCDTPTGTVEFTLNGAGGSQTLASLPLIPVAKDHKLAETAKITATVTVPAGSYTLFAHYLGDGTFSANHASTPFTVTKRSPGVVLIQDSTSTGKGKSVLFTALLNGYTKALSPTGTVRFYDNGHSLGTVGVVPGSVLRGAHAALTTTVLQPGVHTITATYAGNANYTSANSPAVQHTVKYTIDPCAISHCSSSAAPTTSPASSCSAGSQGNAAGDCGVGDPKASASSSSGDATGGTGGGSTGGGPGADPSGAAAGASSATPGSTASGAVAAASGAGSAAAAATPGAPQSGGSHTALWLGIAVVVLLLAVVGLLLAARRRRTTS